MKKQYIRDMDQVHASDELRERTLQKMLAERTRVAVEASKPAGRMKLKLLVPIGIALCTVALVIALIPHSGTMRISRFQYVEDARLSMIRTQSETTNTSSVYQALDTLTQNFSDELKRSNFRFNEFESGTAGVMQWAAIADYSSGGLKLVITSFTSTVATALELMPTTTVQGIGVKFGESDESRYYAAWNQKGVSVLLSCTDSGMLKKFVERSIQNISESTLLLNQTN